jgi:hypothetical protein
VLCNGLYHMQHCFSPGLEGRSSKILINAC